MAAVAGVDPPLPMGHHAARAETPSYPTRLSSRVMPLMGTAQPQRAGAAVAAEAAQRGWRAAAAVMPQRATRRASRAMASMGTTQRLRVGAAETAGRCPRVVRGGAAAMPSLPTRPCGVGAEEAPIATCSAASESGERRRALEGRNRQYDVGAPVRRTNGEPMGGVAFAVRTHLGAAPSLLVRSCTCPHGDRVVALSMRVAELCYRVSVVYSAGVQVSACSMGLTEA